MALTSTFTHRFNLAPRLSASQIAEYLNTTPTGRRRILTEAKYPPVLLTIRYDEARAAVRKHLTKKNPSKDILSEAVQELTHKQADGSITKWKSDNYKLSMEAIAAFEAKEKSLDLGNLVFKSGPNGASKLLVEGVTLSVSLDLLVESTSPKGKTGIGGLVLCFWKTRTDDIPKRCEAIAMLASEGIKKLLVEGQALDPKLCMAIDVFGGEVYCGKPQQKMLYKNVEHSCAEVATVWPSIKPPKSYSGPPIPKI